MGFIKNIEIAWALALRTILLEKKQNFLGFFWELTVPFFYVIFYIFFKFELAYDHQVVGFSNILLGSLGGILLSQVWFNLIKDMSEVITKNRGMLRGLTISVRPFIGALIIQGSFDLIIRLLILLPIIFIFTPSIFDSPNFFFFIIIVCLATLVSASAIGIVLAPWASLFRDVGEFLKVVYLPLIIVSPIFYRLPDTISSPLAIINLFNPFAPNVIFFISIISGQEIIRGLYFWLFCIEFIICVLIYNFLVKYLERKLPIILERLP